MTQIIKDLVTWLKQWFYTESEVDTLLSSKVDVSDISFGVDTVNEYLYFEVS